MCGCVRFTLPANALLSRKINRSTALAFPKPRLALSDHSPPECRKRHFRSPAAIANADLQTDTQSLLPTAQQQKPSFRAFLDFKALKADLDKHVQNCQNRNSTAEPAKVANLYDQYCEAQQQVDGVREERNSNAKAMKVLLPLAYTKALHGSKVNAMNISLHRAR